MIFKTVSQIHLKQQLGHEQVWGQKNDLKEQLDHEQVQNQIDQQSQLGHEQVQNQIDSHVRASQLDHEQI